MRPELSLVNQLIETRKSTIASTPRSRIQPRSWVQHLYQIMTSLLRKCLRVCKIALNWRRWPRYGRYFYGRFASLQGSPKAIARGLACGVFTGFTPLYGLQMVIAVFFAYIIKGNKLAAAAGTWVSNPLTYLPICAMNFKVGQWLLGSSDGSFTPDTLQNLDRLIELSGEFLADLFFGSLVMGLLGSVCSYIIGLQLIYRFRRWRQWSSKEIEM